MSKCPDYDESDPAAIVAYAERLIGHTLRDALDELPPEIDFSAHKGGFGTTLERHYFGYEPNNNAQPDFDAAGIELKATPLKTVRGKLVAKERLVLSMIDYMTIVSEEWESSSFLSKNAHLLLIFYLHEAGGDPRDFEIKIVRLWDFPEEDLEIIRQDWKTIVGKVKVGLAHELSEGDTLYLGACVKAAKGTDRRRQPNSSIPAKPRAFSLKSSYMNTVIADCLGYERTAPLRPAVAAEVSGGLIFEEAVRAKFKPYFGMEAAEIAQRLDVRAKSDAKNYYAVITKRILGLGENDRVAEFEKADLQVKTIRLLPNGRPKEDLPFRAFDYIDLVDQEWETSDLREQLCKRFLFVIYRLREHGRTVLEDVRFWTMPLSHVDSYGRTCFNETIMRIREDRAEYLPKKTENWAVHVRPHARDSSDVIATPTGRLVCRKSFWLNGNYIREQLGL